ncbi:glutamate receptor-like [Chironomus tepperi]|uniref:glutamate receptor-like n=1 Tax=Chironomus tepperi TaxID=113505 RepID=UPI00391F3198
MDMLTFYPFSSNGCNNIQAISINKFSHGNQSWIYDQKVFPQKFTNFHQCPLKVSTYEYQPNVIIEKYRNGTTVIRGFDVEVIRGISRILNFDLKIDILTEPVAWGLIYENGTATGLMKKTMKGDTDIGFGYYYLTLVRAKFMSYAVYTNADIILVIPRGRLMTPLEKLFCPFNTILWTILAIMFGLGIVIISLLKFNPRKFHKYIFGTSDSPHLNMINILLNGGQNFLPPKDSARFILLAFVFFSLIVRTLYQAGIFKFLQTDQRMPAMQTIDEVLDNGFKIYMYESFQEFTKGLKIHNR